MKHQLLLGVLLEDQFWHSVVIHETKCLVNQRGERAAKDCASCAENVEQYRIMSAMSDTLSHTQARHFIGQRQVN